MIVWLNGTFGAGKTTTSNELVKLLPDARIFDSENVGYLLRDVIGDVPCDNFQEWEPWRSLTVATARDVLGFVGGTLVIPQTVLVEDYWTQIRDGLAETGIPVRHFVLHTDADTLTRRINGDTERIRPWRLRHIAPYHDALPWLSRAATVVDTTERAPSDVAAQIAERVGRG
ncbi:AAA family ATPase [Streptomyces sp. NBC_01003]|uniref:AAA family ATPase n=1 Tax=unclassified Streptomyces TaxID=2593676 RepID=UPI0037CDD4E4|nr:AAA family ATPase [Streptomyces sp. NBC_01003]